MFDWNDEELANIIWGEEGDNDDHIVPYLKASEDLSNKKEWNQEAATTKLNELKRSEAKTDFDERKLGSSSNLNNSGRLSAIGYGTNSWPDLSLSSAAKIDHGSRGTEESKFFSELSKFSSSRGGKIETTQLEKESHEGKEQGDFDDYEWANIGSFDDLDQIFSNNDPIFGHVSLDNSDELWSSKDVSNNPEPVHLNSPSLEGALRTEPLEIKEEYVQCNDQSYALSHEKIGGPASLVIQNSHATTADEGSVGVRSKPTGKEQQAFRKKNLLKNRKISQVKQEGKALQDFYGNWSPAAEPARQFENHMEPSVIQSSPSSILGQPKQLHGPETLYQNIINPYMASSVYGNLTNTYPPMPIISQTLLGDLRRQPVLSGYEVSPSIVNPVKKPMDSFKRQTMTPQEKIEKLRRRQQMQALLAIQKQQQQLDHQVPSSSKSITQKCPPEIQSHRSDGTAPEIEDLRALPALDPAAEQDDSNTISVAVDNDFAEDTILYRLQDIISKLDIKIRLCIRDSLFRLAQSAMQRHYASDTSSTNKSCRELEVFARDERNSQNRYARMPDVETQTNPVDRTVAHLLFHRPVELTGSYSDRLESPISSKVQCESKAANLVNFPVRCLPDEDLKSNQQFSHLGFKNSWSSFEAMDQIKDSPCIDTSDNASNTQELETSQ
ncbi:protein LNK2-like isoform X2 [Gastrolobium bilobum]|uniref:protein LNK2-like isoform X2 n=1 Tax=Gastrolobium bilobum TaxID=150636 RepID=UPI002AB08712|nr:protein LNK2-like isoform X2 [Gastrolobium bilobum]